MLANRIQQHNKRIIHHGQVGFTPGMQGCLNVRKSVSLTHKTDRMKKKHAIISDDNEKVFDEIQHPLMIKSS